MDLIASNSVLVVQSANFLFPINQNNALDQFRLVMNTDGNLKCDPRLDHRYSTCGTVLPTKADAEDEK